MTNEDGRALFVVAWTPHRTGGPLRSIDQSRAEGKRSLHSQGEWLRLPRAVHFGA